MTCSTVGSVHRLVVLDGTSPVSYRVHDGQPSAAQTSVYGPRKVSKRRGYSREGGKENLASGAAGLCIGRCLLLDGFDHTSGRVASSPVPCSTLRRDLGGLDMHFPSLFLCSTLPGVLKPPAPHCCSCGRILASVVLAALAG